AQGSAHKAEHVEERGRVVAGRDAVATRRAVREAVEIGHAAEGEADRVEGRARRVRPALAEARRSQDHEPWINGVKLRGRQVPALERARTEVLDDDIAQTDQLPEHLPAPRRPAA